MPMPSAPASQQTPRFGFAQQMRDADWKRFPTWYRARCLLAPMTRSQAKIEPVAFRVAA